MKYLKGINKSSGDDISEKFLKDFYERNPDYKLSTKINSPNNIIFQVTRKSHKKINEDCTVDFEKNLEFFNYDKRYDKDGGLELKYGKIEGSFTYFGNDYSDEPEVRILKNFPHTITENFYLHRYNIGNLVGGPKMVGERYQVRDCGKLTSLDGLPNKLEYLELMNCSKLTSLKGLPDIVDELKIDNTGIQNLKFLPDIKSFLNIKENKNLFDPIGIKDINPNNIHIHSFMLSNPIGEIFQRVFYPYADTEKAFRIFQDSTDWDYVIIDEAEPNFGLIRKKKFQRAIDDCNKNFKTKIEMPPSIPKYKFI